MIRRRNIPASSGVLSSVSSLVTLPVAAQGISAPNPDLAAAKGAWRGQLTYRDYFRPDRLVTLPTRFFVALSAPSDLTLHYVFDGGPSKTVYSFGRMAFDFVNSELIWTSGYPNAKMPQHRILSMQAQEDGCTINFEREEGANIRRYFFNLLPKTLRLGKEEGTSSGAFQFRNRYEFTRGEV